MERPELLFLSAMDDQAQLFPAIACFRLPLSTRSRYYLIRLAIVPRLNGELLVVNGASS